MTYNVFSGTLNRARPINQLCPRLSHKKYALTFRDLANVAFWLELSLLHCEVTTSCAQKSGAPTMYRYFCGISNKTVQLLGTSFLLVGVLSPNQPTRGSVPGPQWLSGALDTSL